MKQFLALKASAGSGKTFALTIRYITLLLKEANPSEILTLTFTNKAANEMSERIYKTLQTLGDDEAYINAIQIQSGFSKQEILGKKHLLIKKFVNATLSIYTIDKFVNKILREFCGYVGISDDFDIKEDDIDTLSYKFLQSLDIEKFEKLIEFSWYENKKFNSLFDLFKLLLEKNEDIKVVNIESSLIPLQKQEVLKYAFKIKEIVLNTSNASNAAKNAVNFETFDDLLGRTWLTKDSVSDYNYFKKFADDTMNAHFIKLKEELSKYYKLRSAYSLNKLFELFHTFKAFKASYNKVKNYLEFNDISNLVYELLSTKIDKDFLYFRLDSKYSHILIDEFQDTSLLQYKILQPLIDEILSGSNEKFKSFFYVGDTKQSIYRFRGGKRELFDYVAKSNSLIEVEVLNTNYRSCENIVNYVNSLYTPLTNYEYHDQLSINKDGYVEVIEDEALNEEDQKFKTIASKIATLLQNGVNSNEIAILTYTNSDVLSLYSYLSSKFPNLKITTEMTSKLINQENVKAIINMIKYLYFKEEIYKENVNAIIGNEPSTKLNLNIDLHKNNIQQVIKIIANTLNLMDENVIKLIEESYSFETIVDFVFEIDKLESSMENSEKTGLQILTIFKSKGLEFHTVLLLDRIKRKTVDKSSLLFEYDEVFLKNIYYKIKDLEHYNVNYNKALKKEKALTYDDELNILYVALTRAKKNLLIFKKQKSSVFDILSIKSLTIGNIIPSSNKSINYEKVEKVKYSPLDLGKQDNIIKVDEEDEKDYSDSLYNRYFGLATHYCLEMLGEFTKTSLKKSIDFARYKYSQYLDESDFIKIENRIEYMLENQTFQNLIKDSSFTSEQSIIYNGEIKIIDLFVQKGDDFYIFDYKTTKEQMSEHEVQVNNYIKAIKEIMQTNRVKGYLLYLKPNEFVLKELI
ncbi:recombinase RecB [Malaciobacter molluscorum LMG 25693]|uniref:DNA 3'-5' helicase n=1 Tax=Malaciobacter molluscorum LMG 25693 TaxID=870501 RepID=A0A2G1DKG6_9BACT|nr:RecB-like helicase [Malaciobacter molluscorum]AXX91364.1 AddAB recombination complex, helicase AddA [Malaciobacter molluscorum LMG 25693]PHO18950.1 recombinase RecB [Malaciobacter molluscorum LMG 25693]